MRGKKQRNATTSMPDWERVISSVSRLQEIIPQAVLVGGSATALHADHRFSRDHDHTVQGLTEHFDEVLKDLESVAGWKTARIQRPVLILGSLDGIETGVRNLIRTAPLETEKKFFNNTEVTLPTEDETLRIKVYLALCRNATRDYVDVAAMADRMGPDRVAAALDRMDELYPQDIGRPECNKWVVRTQIVKQLGQPEPYDLDGLDLSEYKGIKPPYDDWSHIQKQCETISNQLLTRFMGQLEKEQTLEAADTQKELADYDTAHKRGEKVDIPNFPPKKLRP